MGKGKKDLVDMAPSELTPPPPPHHNSTSIISSLMRAELNMHVKQQAWGKVEDLLETDPDVARAVDPATGEVPLHVLARCPKTEPLMVDIAILKYPNALMHRDRKGALPLHAAAATGSIDVLKIIFMAYKDARTAYDGIGRYVTYISLRDICHISSRIISVS